MGLEVLYLLIPVSFALALAALALFLWAIRAGQFDDLETPAIRMLADEIPPDPARSGASAAHEDSGKPEPSH